MIPSKPLRVLHIIDKLSMEGRYPSSCALLLQEWNGCFDPREVSLSVCTLKTDPGGSFLEEHGMRVHYLGFGKNLWRTFQTLSGILEQERTDLLHLHGYVAAHVGRIAARWKKLPCIVHEHAVLRPSLHHCLADLLLGRSTHGAIAVGPGVKDFMARYRFLPAAKVEILPNGRNMARFCQSDQERMRQRAALQIPEKGVAVGSICRLREEKGIEMLIKAARRVVAEEPQTLFFIAGSGPLRESLEKLALAMGLAASVRFLGFRSDIEGLLAALDIVAIPSLSEGFSLSLIEAMMAGKAVVASRLEGMTSVARDGECALYAAPGNPQELAAKILLLIKNPETADGLAREARRQSARYDIRASTALLGNYYQRIMHIREQRQENG